MSSSLTLKQNFVWTLLGNGVYAACQWGILVVLAKLSSPEIVGRFALGLAIGAPVFMLANLQLRAIQATDARREYKLPDYLGLRLVTVLAALAVVGGIVAVSGYGIEVSIVILAVALAKAFESLSDIAYGLFQQRERMDRVATSMALRGVLGLGALALVVHLTGELVLGLVALAVSWGVVALVLDASRMRRTVRDESSGEQAARPRFDRRQLTSLALLALPMGVVMMLVSLTVNVPRYFVEWRLGEGELGIFSALAAIYIAGSMVVSALGQSASPRLARYYSDGDRRRFVGLLFRLLGVGLVLGAIAIAVAAMVGRELLTLLYDSDYAKRNDVFVVLMLAGAAQFVGGFLGTAVTAMRLFKPQLVAHLITVVVTLAAALILIGELGLVGAAWTMVASAGVGLVIYTAIAVWGLARIGAVGTGQART